MLAYFYALLTGADTMSKTKLLLRDFQDAKEVVMTPNEQDAAMRNFFVDLYKQEDQPVVILPNRQMNH